MCSFIDDTLRQIKCEIQRIEDKLDQPDTGLAEIKREIRAIISKLRSIRIPSGILQEILFEVRRIEDKLDHPTTGLVEIKREIRVIEKVLDAPFSLVKLRTSGPVPRRTGTNSIVVVVLNNTCAPQTVTINVFGFEPQCPKFDVPGSPLTVTIDPACSFSAAFDVTVSNNFEVQVKTNIDKGILVWSGGRSEPATSPVFPSRLFGVNIVLNALFIQQLLEDC